MARQSPPQPAQGWEGCQGSANPVLMRAWVQRGAVPEESRGPALSLSPLCPSSSPGGLHCRFPPTERETGRGPRTTAARETEQNPACTVPLPACKGGGGWGSGRPLGLGAQGYLAVTSVRKGIPQKSCSSRTRCLSLMMFAKPLHQRRSA